VTQTVLLLNIPIVFLFAATIVGNIGKKISKGCLHDENYDDNIPSSERISRLERAEKYITVAIFLSGFATFVAITNMVLLFTKVNT
jgi:hypothetical protein